ncbi:MAG: Fuc2NAc and GlcNAc transferase [Bacteroidia bacterium]|jgi:Fuc2NAc and GlcNAc transferase
MTVVFLTLLLSALLCFLFLRVARRWRIMDTPNERSSHALPTPHGGGVPLLVAFSIGLLVASQVLGDWPGHYYTMALVAQLLMVLGVLDDLLDLAVGLRMAVYGLVSLFLTGILLEPLHLEGLMGWLLLGGTGFVVLWLLNLYNFMDGIDGIAALQTILACSSAGLLTFFSSGEQPYTYYCLLLAAAHLGFLCWNWPPARLFMGDAGSVPTGFLVAFIAIEGFVQGWLNPLCWLILLAPFITDATWTLLWRFFTRQPFTRPHRLHAYQRLSRHWDSHLRVDMLLLAVHALWLLPLAFVAQHWPAYGPIVVILAYLPLLLGMTQIRGLA